MEDLKPVSAMDLLMEAHSELGAAIIVSLPTDDQMIMDHVRTAKLLIEQIMEAQRKA